MNNQALLKHSGPVPRYTSYPTAPNFTPAVGPDTHLDWLAALGPEHNLSLYFHVPFCKSLCWFCGCNTSVAADPLIAESYAELLALELPLIADATPSVGSISHIHWGGGTPTEIGEKAIRQVMERVGELFELSDTAEIAIEVDPRTPRPSMAKTLGALGFNRAS